eukprot:15480879-Alexandrium_andersonii.AAC.1
MSWPAGRACGPSRFRRRQTPARGPASRTGTCARCHSPPRADSATPPCMVPDTTTPRQAAHGGSGHHVPAEPGGASS